MEHLLETGSGKNRGSEIRQQVLATLHFTRLTVIGLKDNRLSSITILVPAYALLPLLPFRRVVTAVRLHPASD